MLLCCRVPLDSLLLTAVFVLLALVGCLLQEEMARDLVKELENALKASSQFIKKKVRWARLFPVCVVVGA